MTKYSIEEQNLLNKLKIKNFREINKDNLMNLYSQLKDLPPEIAEKALEQVKHFTSLAGTTIKDYKDLAINSLESLKGSQAKVYEQKIQEFNLLQDELKFNNLSFDQKMNILDKIHTVTEDMRLMDESHKSTILNFLSSIAKFFTLALGAVLIFVIGKNPFDNKS